jgi:hypothetical protein
MNRKTPAQRAADVLSAVHALPALVTAAQDAALQHGWNDPRTLTAWERVEAQGATVHRQARLLAGKSRGG